jgi:two-component system, NarL family, sensor kinase
MDTQTTTNYPILLASLIFLTVLLAMFIIAMLRQYRFRLQEYEWQLTREVTLIDAERKRMYIDLHDEIGAGLAAVGVLIQQPSTKNDTIQQKIWKLVQDMRSKIKEIAYDFTPPTLESLGLKATIIGLLEEINGGLKIKTESYFDFDDKQLFPEKTVHIYRIIKEILANALKHSQCTLIYCSLYEEEKHLILSISDNGSGIATNDHTWKRKGSGISHIHSRVKLLHATINITTIPAKGMNYHIRIPIESLINKNIHGQ